MTRNQLLIGRRLLKRLLPAAIEEAAKKPSIEFRLGTEVARAAHSHMTMDKLDAVHIYEGSLGGWIVDVVMRDMPPGISPVMGTPVAQPHATRQQAQEAAHHLLVYIVKMIQANHGPPAAPVFEYHGCAIPIHKKALDFLFANGFHEAPLTSEHALERLREIDLELFPLGVTEERWEQLTDDQRSSLFAIFHMAAAKGIFRFPEPEAKPPNSN